MVVATKEKKIEYKLTNVFYKNLIAYESGKRRALNEGGTSSSKTFSILQAIDIIAAHNKKLISIVSESLPHLRKGCIRDFFSIKDESPDNNDNYNRTECIYKYPSGSIVEFFGADEQGKVKGPRRDILFINEANNVPWETARQLDVRTEHFTFVDWNPEGEFWAHEFENEEGKLIPGWIHDPENEYVHSTYLDALDVLSPATIENIERNKKDPSWWRVYGEGKLGEKGGLVYPEYEVVTQLPPGTAVYGLDFGYSNDPTAFVKNIIKEDSVYSQELIYKRGLFNKDISKLFGELGLIQWGAEIWADSSDPKSIQELRDDGWNVKPVEKKQGSVEWGRGRVKQLKQYWTRDSLNGLKEQRNFRFIRKKDSATGILRWTDDTTHAFSHLMDARRYAVMQGKITGYSPTLLRY